MTRTLIFAGLAAVGLLIPSCIPIFGCSSSIQPHVKTIEEELEMVKKGTLQAITLTTRKVKDEEVNLNTGKEIIDNLNKIIKNADSLLTVCAQLDYAGSREVILHFIELARASIQNKWTTLNCLNDLYNMSTHHQFETDTYFPAEVFGVPPNKLDEAQKSVGPIVQRIIKFLNDHPGQKFVAVIVCYGFTDENPGALEAILNPPGLTRCTGRKPTRQEVIVKFSELRAKAIARLVMDQIKSNEEFIPHPALVSYDIQWEGKGDALPYPDKIKDYKPEDKRRRVIDLTWNVVPASLYTNKNAWDVE